MTDPATEVIAVAIVVAAVVVAAVCVIARKPRRVVLWSIAITLAGLLAAFGLIWLERCNYQWARGGHLATLAAAVNVYYQQHATLPPQLDEIEATGLYGKAPYRAPANGWEQTASGPPPVYLPATAAPPDEGFIVALEGITSRTPEERGYVILGDTVWHRADPGQLAALLAEDNARRERAGEPRRWRIETGGPR